MDGRKVRRQAGDRGLQSPGSCDPLSKWLLGQVLGCFPLGNECISIIQQRFTEHQELGIEQ